MSDRWSYLEKVRDVGMDLVDDSNAVAEDSCSLSGVESGLDMRENPTISMRQSTGKIREQHTSSAGYSCRESSMVSSWPSHRAHQAHNPREMNNQEE
jgi:hypothetical protein